MNETVRRVILWIVSLGGWSWAIGAATWAVLEFDPSEGHFAPQWLSLSVFLSMGFAIAAGVTIGRLNSVRTLSDIFRAGTLSERIERNTKMIDELYHGQRDKIERNTKSIETLKEEIKK
jgi:hypothetical protein